MRSTHTYAILEISRSAYEEIRTKLEQAGYQDQFHDDNSYSLPVIDMHGIAVAPEQLPTDTNVQFVNFSSLAILNDTMINTLGKLGLECVERDGEILLRQKG